MAESIFDDKSEAPTSSELEIALGKTAALLKEIEQHLFDLFGEITHEWKFYGKKAGWTLALVYKDRRILHLIPRSGLFTVVFTLGKRAALISQGSDLPAGILSAIENAREYAEGKSIRFDVLSTEDVAIVRKLVAIKMSN
jgi:hypothetical protein